jgi:hypothetical protein
MQIESEVMLDMAGAPIDVQYLSLDDTVCVVSDAGDVLLVQLATKQVLLACCNVTWFTRLLV